MTDSQPRRSLYRTYRPQTFTEVIGQEHVARTLVNAISSDRLAHGYVFAGTRGTGKTSMARILAKALNCTGPDPARPRTEPTIEPCGVCESCRRIAETDSLDVVEMDAASHRSIDDIRELRERVAYTPVQDRYKVYIIDEAHMLTREAFNALLKTLEEPPPNVVFILATTEAFRLPDTIVSRCQRFDFRRPDVRDIVRVLRRVADGEGFTVTDDALATIAEHSEGGFRDAIGALERLAAFSAGGEAIGTQTVLELLGVTDTDLLVELTSLVADRNTSGVLQLVDRLYARGANWTQFITDLLRHLRRLFLLQHIEPADGRTLRAVAQTVGLHEALVERLLPQAEQLDPAVVIRFMELLGAALGEIKGGLDGRLQLELALVKVTRPQLDLSLEGLDTRLRRLEDGSGPAAPAQGGRDRGVPEPPTAQPDARPAAPGAKPAGKGGRGSAAGKTSAAEARAAEAGAAAGVAAARTGGAATPKDPAPSDSRRGSPRQGASRQDHQAASNRSPADSAPSVDRGADDIDDAYAAAVADEDSALRPVEPAPVWPEAERRPPAAPRRPASPVQDSLSLDQAIKLVKERFDAELLTDDE